MWYLGNYVSRACELRYKGAVYIRVLGGVGFDASTQRSRARDARTRSRRDRDVPRTRALPQSVKHNRQKEN